MSSIEVTDEVSHVGMRVVRGPKWNWENQDCDSMGKQRVGTIEKTDKGCVYVTWDDGKLNGIYYPTNGCLSLYTGEALVEKPKDLVGYTRLSADSVVEPGDQLIAMTNTSQELYYYTSGGIVPGRIYTVKYLSRGVIHNGIRVNAVTCLCGEVINDYCVDIRCFAMYKRKADVPVVKDPYEEQYLLSSSVVSVGDKLIFRRHKDDSAESNITIGEEVVVTSAYSHRITTNKKPYWNVNKECFTRVSAPPVDPYELIDPYKSLYLTSSEGIEVGDKVVFRRHLADSHSANLSIGEAVQITEIVSSGKHFKTNKKDWWVPIGCFTFFKKGNKNVVEKLREEVNKVQPYYVQPSHVSAEQYEMTTKGPKKVSKETSTKSSSISSNIKKEEHVRTINTTGRVIKVCRTHLKIERGEGIRGIIVQGRADKARIASK